MEREEGSGAGGGWSGRRVVALGSSGGGLEGSGMREW